MLISVLVSTNTSLYKKKLASDFDINTTRSKIVSLLHSDKLEVLENNAPSNSPLSLAVYYNSPTCKSRYIAIPISISLEADAYLARIVPPGYTIKYYLYNYQSSQRNKTRLIYLYLKQSFYNALGLAQYLPAAIAIVEATPSQCKESPINWSSIWDIEWNKEFHIGKFKNEPVFR